MRLIYLDEAGRGAGDGHYFVVAGVVVEGDQQYRDVDAYLRELGRQYFPDDPDSVVFHAQNIWHGSGRFPRETWSRFKRHRLLKKLAEIPRRFNLLVVCGPVLRAKFPSTILLEEVEDKNQEIAIHASALLICALAVEEWIRLSAPSENAILFAENTDRVKRVIKNVHRHAKNPAWADNFVAQHSSRNAGLLPLTHIIDTVHFVEKHDSRLLQVADICAFFIKRQLNGKSDAAPFYERLRSQMWRYPYAGERQQSA